MKLSSYVIKSILLILIVTSGNIRPGDAAPVTTKALAPAFRVTSLDGQVFDLADLHGKVVVLNLWFIGCPPCRKEIPELNNLVEEFKGKDVGFLALALDKAEELRAFIKEQPFNYHIVPEAKQVIKRYGGWVYP